MATNEAFPSIARTRRTRSWPRVAILLVLLSSYTFAGCTDAGGGLADNGGMSGTGISQGSISSFGSIFVNGVEWDLSGSTISIDGLPATEADLRVGMVVRIAGDFDAGNASGQALDVRYDDVVEGPITATPVETVPGVEKTFEILGRTIIVDAITTVFDDGASFDSLAADEVLEVTGFEDETDAVRATRVSRKNPFPGNADVDLRGVVSSLVVNPDDSGLFDLGPITVRFDSMTGFEDVTRSELANGDVVEVEGALRPSGTEIDATEVELRSTGFGVDDRSRVEVEGVVRICVASPDFCVENVAIDASSAVFEPSGFMPMPGDRVEVEGPLVSGTLQAVRIENETSSGAGAGSGSARTVRIEAAVTSVDPVARTLVILGVTVEADGSTSIRDQSSIEDENFQFGEIQPGDYLEVRGVDDGGANVRALLIERDDATPGSDDVRLEGPVTAFSTTAPYGLEILEQPVPIDGATLYFDSLGASRTATEFFETPGDVMLGDVVRVEDQSAASLSTLGAVDEVEIEDPL